MIKLSQCPHCKKEIAKTAFHWRLGDKGKTFWWKENKYTITGDEYGHEEHCEKYQEWPKVETEEEKG